MVISSRRDQGKYKHVYRYRRLFIAKKDLSFSIFFFFFFLYLLFWSSVLGNKSMAGMLPGVECARRRRFHQSGGSSDCLTAPAYGGTRRPSFCLYTSNNEKTHHITSTSLMKQRSISIQVNQDDQKLGVEAREARERLDGRLRTQRKSESIRKNGKSVVKGDEVQVEVYGTRRSGSRRFSWANLSWKASDQEECAICLEGFRAGETLVHLPCAHRFHHCCLVPWLENNSHCPCCRTVVSVMTQI